jgi:hypothetical protein
LSQVAAAVALLDLNHDDENLEEDLTRFGAYGATISVLRRMGNRLFRL